MSPGDVIARFPGLRRSGNGWIGRCNAPGHDDRQASLSIRISDDGRRVLLHCFAQCRPEDICAGVGLKLSDLFDSPNPTPRQRLSPLDEARRDTYSRARRQAERLEELRPFHEGSDLARTAERAATTERMRVLGREPTESEWDVLAKVAKLEVDAWALEAETQRDVFGKTLW